MKNQTVVKSVIDIIQEISSRNRRLIRIKLNSYVAHARRYRYCRILFRHYRLLLKMISFYHLYPQFETDLGWNCRRLYDMGTVTDQVIQPERSVYAQRQKNRRDFDADAGGLQE